ncbi:MAG: L,D-transpeptidase family protein [Gammaproteobacteria bacterium]
MRDEIRAHVEQLASGDLIIEGTPVTSTTVLATLYQQRDFDPLWTNSAAVRQLVAAVQEAEHDGLNPDEYHRAALEALQTDMEAGRFYTPERKAGVDVLLTDSLIRLAYHLLMGKVDPVDLDSNWNVDRTINGRDAILALTGAVNDAGIDRLLDDVRPREPYYRRLRQALEHYRAIAAEGGWPSVPEGATLKRGMSDERVAAVRRRLAVNRQSDDAAPDSALFDAELEKAVQLFQKQHSLQIDGVVGRQTLAAMNVPVQARIDQIRVNLERARWVLHDMPEEYVLVDIAGYNVRYVRDGQSIWQARAQVGKPYRKTPVFRSKITYLEINPTWTVPPTILRNDVLPAIRRDNNYLKTRNMRVIDYDHNVVDPATIDWSRYTGPDFPYLLRQEPGPGNALGRIKFMFPNKHLVYLHDTPSKALFEQTERAFSSGCIRVEHPYRFAELLLDDPQRWNRSAIVQAIDSRQTRTVNLPRPVTVLLLYWTVAPGEADEVVFKPDIYHRDAPVLAALDADVEFRPVFTWAAAERTP